MCWEACDLHWPTTGIIPNTVKPHCWTYIYQVCKKMGQHCSSSANKALHIYSKRPLLASFIQTTSESADLQRSQSSEQDNMAFRTEGSWTCNSPNDPYDKLPWPNKGKGSQNPTILIRVAFFIFKHWFLAFLGLSCLAILLLALVVSKNNKKIIN